MAKKILCSVISFILCAVIAFVSCYFAIPDFSAWVKGTIAGSTAGDNGNNADDNKDDDNSGDNNFEIENNGIALLCAELPVEAYAANGVSEQALEAYILTVNRSPAISLVNDFEWVIEFVTPLPSWANEKTVTDYVTITVADDNLSAVVECLQPFGARVQATVSYVPDITKSATCYFDYQQQIDTVVLYLDEDNFVFNTEYWAEIDVRLTYTVGTMKFPHIPTDVTEAHYELSDEAYNAIINSDYYKTWLKASRGVVSFEKSTVDYIKSSVEYSPDSVIYNCRVDSFLEFSIPTEPLFYLDGIDYLAAAFINAAETVKDFFRLVGTVVECNGNTGEVVYTYGTAYSVWLELDTSNISSDALILDGISFPEDSYIFGQ